MSEDENENKNKILFQQFFFSGFKISDVGGQKNNNNFQVLSFFYIYHHNVTLQD